MIKQPKPGTRILVKDSHPFFCSMRGFVVGPFDEEGSVVKIDPNAVYPEGTEAIIGNAWMDEEFPENPLLSILQSHVGRGHGIGVKELAGMMDVPERKVRDYVTDARRSGHPVCGEPGTGYYLAATPEELEETCQFLQQRALTSLALVAALRRVPLGSLMGQMKLEA